MEKTKNDIMIIGLMTEPVSAHVLHTKILEPVGVNIFLRHFAKNLPEDEQQNRNIVLLADKHLGERDLQVNLLAKAIRLANFEVVGVMGDLADAWASILQVPAIKGKPRGVMTMNAVAERQEQLAAVKAKADEINISYRAPVVALSETILDTKADDVSYNDQASVVQEKISEHPEDHISADNMTAQNNLPETEDTYQQSSVDEVRAVVSSCLARVEQAELEMTERNTETAAPAFDIPVFKTPENFNDIKSSDTAEIVIAEIFREPSAEDILRERLARMEAGRLARDREEEEMRLELVRMETERAEQARIEAERAQFARLEAERIEAERAEQERLEAERLEFERIEFARMEAERIEAERLEFERLEAERLEAERIEAERIEAERLEAERIESDRLEFARIEAERIAQEAREAEFLEFERLEFERAEAERLELEAAQIALERAEKEERDRVAENARIEAERMEAEWLLEQERQQEEASRLERERFHDEEKAQKAREQHAVTADTPMNIEYEGPERDHHAPIEQVRVVVVESIKPQRVQGRVRSGQLITHSGDIIVEGCVHPGGELVATGDIHIYGKGAGRLLAGVAGDLSACIYVQNFDAELISIAGKYYTFDNPDEYRHWRGRSLKVSLKDGSLMFEAMEMPGRLAAKAA